MCSYCLNLPPESRSIDPLHFRKTRWLLVKYCIANTVFKYWNGIVPGYIHEMFKPSSLLKHLVSQMELYIPLRKTITYQKRLSFLGPKIWSKINRRIKILTKAFFHCML